jgi:hypothetical protein
VEDSGLPDLQVPLAMQMAVQDLPDFVLQFLLPSRYCEVDSELKDLAWTLFRNTSPGWPRVQAVCDFANRHIRFDYQQARPTRTALEAYRERVGVCRDYMHLAITLCALVIWVTSAFRFSRARWISVRGLRYFWAVSGTHSMPETTSQELVAS